MTTPFDEDSLSELDILNLPAYKISSTDITNLLFLKKIAKKGKPMLISTGMSYLHEVTLALETIYKYNQDVVLLQCTANYPIDDHEVNLSVLNSYRENFDILLGYSDHSTGIGAAPYAIPMGAKIVEKHFTYDKNSNGPDHQASLSPEELHDFVKTIRNVDKYMGSSIKEPTSSEKNTRMSLQKCLVANKKIRKGDKFSEDNIIAKRTGGVGISPINLDKVMGKESKNNYEKDEVISID